MPDTAPNRSTNLIWIDLEMTGLCTQTDTIIEIATVVTDKNLAELAVGPVMAIRKPTATMDKMDEWNTRHHGNSGLTARVLESSTGTAEAEQATLNFLREWVDKGASPMSGNSICQDRRFLAREMPDLERFFSLSQSRCQHLEDTRVSLGSAGFEGFSKGFGPSGVVRYS